MLLWNRTSVRLSFTTAQFLGHFFYDLLQVQKLLRLLCLYMLPPKSSWASTVPSNEVHSSAQVKVEAEHFCWQSAILTDPSPENLFNKWNAGFNKCCWADVETLQSGTPTADSNLAQLPRDLFFFVRRLSSTRTFIVALKSFKLPHKLQSKTAVPYCCS